MCGKVWTIAIVVGSFLIVGGVLAQDSPSEAAKPDSVSVDSAAVRNKFKMYDLGVTMKPTPRETQEASEQLEQMATQSAKDLAKSEQERARAHIDSVMQAEANADSMKQALADSVQKAPATAQSQAAEEDTITASPTQPTPMVTQQSDTLISLADLQRQLESIRVKYQTEIADLRDKNVQLARKVEYLQGQLRAVQKTPTTTAPATPRSLTNVAPKDTSGYVAPNPLIERYYLVGVRKYYSSNFAGALSEFERVVSESTNRDLAADAQYWIGECYFQLNNFSQAIQEMLQYINAFHGTKHRKDALVILGLSSKRQGDLKKALNYFEQVVKEFPDSDYAKIAKSEVQKLRYITS